VRARRKWKDGEPDAMRRAALVTWRPRGVRELWRMRKRLFAWGARGSLCSVRRPETDKWETRQLAAQKRVSIGTLPSLDGKKAKGSASAVR
jgi:hypothetical protein